VAYMSPEQVRAEDVDGRTDVWSLGTVLYESVSGHLPFAGRTPSDTLAAILEHEPPALAPLAPNAPAELQRIVAKALRKERDRRYEVMRDLQLDLETLRDELKLARHSSDVGAATAASRGASAGFRARGAAKGIAIAALVLAAAGGWWANNLWAARHASA